MELFLNVASGPLAGNSYEINGGEVIGRETGDIILNDPKVSSRHAIVKKTMLGKLAIYDQGSKNGLKVGGKRVEKLTLEPGVTFQIGSSHFAVSKLPSQTKKERDKRKAQASAQSSPSKKTLEAPEANASEGDPFVGLEQMELSSSGLSSNPALKALADEISLAENIESIGQPLSGKARESTKSSEAGGSEPKVTKDPSISMAAPIEKPIEGSIISEGIATGLKPTSSDELLDDLDEIEAQLASPEEEDIRLSDIKPRDVDSEEDEVTQASAIDTAVLDELLDDAVTDQLIQPSDTERKDVIAEPETTPSPFSEEATIVSAELNLDLEERIDSTVVSTPDLVNQASRNEESRQSKESSHDLNPPAQELNFKIVGHATEIAKLDAALEGEIESGDLPLTQIIEESAKEQAIHDTEGFEESMKASAFSKNDLSLPSFGAESKASASGFSLRTLDKKRQNSNKPEHFERRNRWNNILEDFARDNIRQVVSAPAHLEPFQYPLKLTFFKGIQSETEWILGYGPRYVGKGSSDLPVLDEGVPDGIVFSIHPDGDTTLLKTEFPDVVSVNGLSRREVELKNGDIITFLQTEIEVEMST